MPKIETKKKKPRRNPLLVWGIPPELRKRFRMRCIQRGVTMQRAIQDLMRLYCA